MNQNECANCRLHGWIQPEKKDDLLRCKRCKVTKYCGKECQTEHWLKLHKRQCRYFADLTKIPQSKHEENSCLVCYNSVGGTTHEIGNFNTPNYECLYKSKEWGVLEMYDDLYHTHPFPANGQPENIKEKLVLVMWHLVHKFKQIHLGYFGNFQEELNKFLNSLLLARLDIWRSKKIYPKPEHFCPDMPAAMDMEFWENVDKATKRCVQLVNPFQMWNIIRLVTKMSMDEYTLRMLSSLKDPFNTMPTDLKKYLSLALNNRTKFIVMVSQILQALDHQIIPYETVLKIICGGSLKKVCSICSKQVNVIGIGVHEMNGPVIFFDYLFMGMVLCGTGNCHDIRNSMAEDWGKFSVIVSTAAMKRDYNRCDNCFLLSPVGYVHRCSRCCTTMYCSKSCQREDWKIHKEVCREEADIRKIKFGVEERRVVANANAREEENNENHIIKEACEMLRKCEFNQGEKKSNK